MGSPSLNPSLLCCLFFFRNPDGDKKPWCFFKVNNAKVKWEYCDVSACSAPGKTVAIWRSGSEEVVDTQTFPELSLSPTLTLPPHLLHHLPSLWQPSSGTLCSQAEQTWAALQTQASWLPVSAFSKYRSLACCMPGAGPGLQCTVGIKHWLGLHSLSGCNTD